MSKTTQTIGTTHSAARAVLPLLVLCLFPSLSPSARAENVAGANKAEPRAFETQLLASPASSRHLPFAPVQLTPAAGSRELHRWKVSLVPLAASQALDISSSWGMRELNPVLAGREQRFGMQAASVKLGVMGAFVGIQYLVVKKYPRTARAFEKINWTGAALTSSFEIHNYAIR